MRTPPAETKSAVSMLSSSVLNTFANSAEAGSAAPRAFFAAALIASAESSPFFIAAASMVDDDRVSFGGTYGLPSRMAASHSGMSVPKATNARQIALKSAMDFNVFFMVVFLSVRINGYNSKKACVVQAFFSLF